MPIPSQVAIVVNGSARPEYEQVMTAHPKFRFLFVRRPLGFTAAIRMGLRHLSTGWTYLLNNDVSLNDSAMAALWPHRAPDVFSLASRIVMADPKSERETNRTGIQFVDGLANLLELDGALDAPVEHFYSGGGCSLFQTGWLRHFVDRTTCYDPFYWEDAEWGVRARSLGMRNIFVPDSSGRHDGKATVSRFYEPAEVARIFERNRIQFQLRCMPGGDISAVRERLAHAPWKTLAELSQPFRLSSMARTRASLAISPR
jgi:GT2 family glycosyltransferase